MPKVVTVYTIRRISDGDSFGTYRSTRRCRKVLEELGRRFPGQGFEVVVEEVDREDV